MASDGRVTYVIWEVLGTMCPTSQVKLNGEINVTMKRALLAVALVAIATMDAARAESTNHPPAFSQPLAPATNNPAKSPLQPPKIQFDKTVYDFGATSLVDSVTGTFTFRNAGTGRLRVGDLQPVASVVPRVLKPGEKGEVVFNLKVGGEPGTIAKYMTVTSNDPQTPSISLLIKVQLKEVLDISPPSIQLGNIQPGTITSVSVLVRRTDDKKLVISKAEPSSKLLRTRIEPVESSSNRSANVIVEVENEGTPLQFKENVRLFLEGILEPVSVIIVAGHMLGDVTAEPAMLYWPMTGAASTNSEALPAREIKVSASRPNYPLEIKNLTTNIKDLKLELVTKAAGKTYVVVARFTQSPKHSAQGEISFETNLAGQPKVAIPVTIAALSQSP